MTHPQITNKLYRRMLANELLTLRRVFKDDINSDFVQGVRVGLDTAFRRLENEDYMRSLGDDKEQQGI